MILAASSSQPDKQQLADQPSEQIRPALDNIAIALGEANRPSDLDQPCEEGENDRSSDLCAQWKAADAARRAANATWLFGGLSSLTGAFTLAAAIAAALYARRAADATEKAVHVAEEGAVDLPILVVTRILSDHTRTAGDSGHAPDTPITIRLTFHNYGRTVAILERFWLDHYSGSHSLPPEPLLHPYGGHHFALGTVVEVDQDFTTPADFGWIPEISDLDRVLDRQNTLFFYGNIDFSDFRGQRHRVGFKFGWSREGGDGSDIPPKFTQHAQGAGNYVYRRRLKDGEK